MDEVVKVYTPKNNRIQYEQLDKTWSDVMEDSKKKEKVVKTVKMAKNNIWHLIMAKFDKGNRKKKDKTIVEVKQSTKRREPKKYEDSKLKSYYDTLCEVFEDRRVKEAKLAMRHPWYNIIYNWVIGILVVALFASFIWWGIQIKNDRKEASIRATAYAEWTAEQEKAEEERIQALAKAEEERKQSEEYIEGIMTEVLSKMYYGIKNFEDKYHYTEADFETYGRCAWNRMMNPSYSSDFEEVVFQKDQFLNCNQSNPSNVEPYHTMAKNHIHKWRTETTVPVSNDYVYAELTPNGVYLKNKFDADGYAVRWRAT